MTRVAPPPPVSSNPLAQFMHDLRLELSAPAPFPLGDSNFSLRRTHRGLTDVLGLLLDAYARYGPIFTLRIAHRRLVIMLGPAAHNYLLLSHADNFRWRDGLFGDLVPLLGDGLFTTDGAFARRSRRILLPAFHRDRVGAALGVIHDEVDRAVAGWDDGAEVDAYAWARELTLRIALRALFGIEPDRRGAARSPAKEFERAVAFYGREHWVRLLRGPRTPWATMMDARRQLDELIAGEIARRRRSQDRGEDVLSLLLEAEDEDGQGLSDSHVRDEVMTLMFAGHDTATATMAFFFYELARHPAIADAIAEEVAALRRTPTAADLIVGEAVPTLRQSLDETLRLYPPAWIGARRCIETFDLLGVTVPAGALVSYSSYASHRLPDVWDNPEAFYPERFSPDARSKLPKGAYVPFGGGSRTCLGMRFAQLEIMAAVLRVLRAYRLELPPGYRLEVRLSPTLAPKNGPRMRVRAV